MLKPDPVAYPPRGMSREEAARYIGVGETMFDWLVATDRMPKPKRIKSRLVWDRWQLDSYFSDIDQIPTEKQMELEAKGLRPELAAYLENAENTRRESEAELATIRQKRLEQLGRDRARREARKKGHKKDP